MSGLNDDQKRHLLTTFRDVDERLGDLLALLDSQRQHSPFSEYIPDATPVQHRVVADHVARVRASMRRILDEQGIALTPPDVSSVWAARTGLTLAEIAIEELRPKYLRGYGALSEEAAASLEAAVVELREWFTRVESFLAQGPGRDLQARLARLEQAGLGVRELRSLQEVTSRHGLIEFRSALDMLSERLASPALEVAVFGRVSSGKSSLLNRIVGADVLPVGVTPVTAVPTRLIYGPHPKASVSFAQAEPLTVAVDRLVEFVSEQQNPGNGKHVTRVVVELPSRLLRERVVLVDTPGLGSLATAGTAESLAYLPRCDLGLILIDAGSTLEHDDLSLLQLLVQSGADVMVLLSKADMLGEGERQQAADYIGQQVALNLGFEVQVYPVSVRGSHESLGERWRDEVLAGYLRQCQAHADRSLRRKIGGLCEAVTRALRRRVARAGRQPSTAATDRVGRFERALAESLLQLDTSTRQDHVFRGVVGDVAEHALEALIHAVVEHWPADREPVADITDQLLPTVVSALQPHLAGLLNDLSRLRAEVARALRQLAELADVPDPGATGLSEARDLPGLEGNTGNLRLRVRRPTLGFVGRLAHRSLRTQLLDQQWGDVRAALEQYAQRVDIWRQSYLASLRRELVATADLYRSRLGAESVVAPSDASDLNALRQTIVELEDLTTSMPDTPRPATPGSKRDSSRRDENAPDPTP